MSITSHMPGIFVNIVFSFRTLRKKLISFPIIKKKKKGHCLLQNFQFSLFELLVSSIALQNNKLSLQRYLQHSQTSSEI